MKHFILITSPPASGKTFVAKQLAKMLGECVYLDKDALIPLSKQIFQVARQPFDRSSDFFEEHVRNYEYLAVMDVAFEALEFSRFVLINAPFTRELRDEQYLMNLRKKLDGMDAKLSVLWVHTDIEVCRQRMIARNSERDTWKLSHWEEYVAAVNFAPPPLTGLCIIDNSTENSYQKPLKEFIDTLK